jgi:hypothetical protein
VSWTKIILGSFIFGVLATFGSILVSGAVAYVYYLYL